MSKFRKTTSLALLFALIGSGLFAESSSGAYLAARQARAMGDFGESANYFQRTLGFDRENQFALENLVYAYIAMGKIADSTQYAHQLDKLGSENTQVTNFALFSELADQERYDELVTFIDGGKGAGGLVDGLITAWSRMGQGNMTDALAAFDKLIEKDDFASFALGHKALAMASIGDFEGAEAIFEAEDNQPIMRLSRRLIIARLQVMSQNDHNQTALELVESLLGSDVDQDFKPYVDALKAGKRLDFDVVLGPKDGLAEIFFAIASELASSADPELILIYSRIAEFLNPKNADATLLSAQLLSKMGQHQLAAENFKKIGADSPLYYLAEMGRADALTSQGQPEAGIEVLEQLLRLHPELAAVHTGLGDAHRQQENFAKAVPSYDNAIKLLKGDGQWFVFYARAICHERLGNWDKAEADFRKALELEPDQPQVLNYLGYSLVEANQKLDEALAMIEKAVALRPDSGYIIDSLGWAYFRLGRYDEAVVQIERAIEYMATDPIVNDHLGDVYWAVGRKREARFQWERALSFKPEEKDAARIREKLSVGLDKVLEAEGAKPLKMVKDGN